MADTFDILRIWSSEQAFRAELAAVSLGPGQFAARGVVIATEPLPYRLDYRLTTAAGYVTSRLTVVSNGAGWCRSLDLGRTPAGAWSCLAETEGEAAFGEGSPSLPVPGGDVAALAGALDCDLGLSPLTNTMPVLRHGLLSGGTCEILTAWVSVPDLAVYPSRQRYTFLGREPGATTIRFQSLDSDLSVEVLFDGEGLVLDYPGIARRIA